MLRKYVLRNRSLREWARGTTLLTTNGCDLAAGILSVIAAGLSAFA
ncbi:MAG: hypothetical protein HRF43_09305 [Phycisphaerae bacterium]|jgi:hypothetical protein